MTPQPPSLGRSETRTAHPLAIPQYASGRSTGLRAAALRCALSARRPTTCGFVQSNLRNVRSQEPQNHAADLKQPSRFPNRRLSYSTWRTAFRRIAMSRPVPLRTGFDAVGLRKLARQSPAGIYAGGPARTRRGLAASERRWSQPQGARALREAGKLLVKRAAPKRLRRAGSADAMRTLGNARVWPRWQKGVKNALKGCCAVGLDNIRSNILKEILLRLERTAP